MSQFTSVEYWKEVSSIAAYLVSESADYNDCNTIDTFDRDTVLEYINDSALHETIDGHQWVIYYAYNLPVLEYSKIQLLLLLAHRLQSKKSKLFLPIAVRLSPTEIQKLCWDAVIKPWCCDTQLQ